MGFSPEPVFFASVKRNSGAKRRLIRITSSENRDVEVVVKDVEKPEWVDIEGVFPGEKLRFERNKPPSFIVNLNTTHKFFPKKPVQDEAVKVTLETDETFSVLITIAEVKDIVEQFRGVFALDFGTTNSCYAFRGGTAKASKALQQAKCSPEIPSVIYFHDVSDPVQPNCSIGVDAVHEVHENASRFYSYVLSSKRMLGQDRTLMMMDKLGGAKPGHRQEWHIEEIVSFVVRQLITRAEEELDQRIGHVVATYPPMFTRSRKDSLHRALVKALGLGGAEAKDENVVLHLDEANAATFHYIYRVLLDEFRRFNVKEKSVDLLTYDFGGGTVDISLVGVKISRTPDQKIVIETELKGLTGDAQLGGDNITLELFRIVKWRVAAAIARERKKAIDEKRRQEEDAAKPKNKKNIWEDEEEGDKGAGAFGRKKAEPKAAEAKAPEPVLDPELALIVNRENPAAYEAAVATVEAELQTLEDAISSGKAIAAAVAAREKVRHQVEARAKKLEAAIEMLVPTRFATYQDVDPHKEELARKLFHEIWQAADPLKIRLSGAESDAAPCRLEGDLAKIARYAGVDALALSELSVKLQELDARIDAKMTESVKMARDLHHGAQGSTSGDVAVAAQVTDENLRVLLYGNSSNLPIVKRKFQEFFKIPPQNLVHGGAELKTAVAAGACDEYELRKFLSGLITYKPSGFLDRLPYSVGLFHRELSLIGWERGFWPLFPRGSAHGSTKDVDEKSNFLIHPDLQELPIYADHLDGAPPRTIGFIDFRKPLDRPTDPASFSAPRENPDAKVPLRLELLPSRELIATNLNTGQSFGMVLEKVPWVTEENPFSGVH